MSHAQPTVVIVQPTKSAGVAAILGILFGPLGLLYAGLRPALLMLVVNVLVGGFTLGVGLVLTWPLCGLVGWSAANASNKKLLAGATGRMTP